MRSLICKGGWLLVAWVHSDSADRITVQHIQTCYIPPTHVACSCLERLRIARIAGSV